MMQFMGSSPVDVVISTQRNSYYNYYNDSSNTTTTSAAAADVNQSDLGTAVANLTIDLVTIALLSLLAITTVVQYIGKRAHRLVHLVLCFNSPQRCIRRSLERCGSRESWKNELRTHKWIYFILNSCVLFILVRIFHECLTAVSHSLHLESIRTGNDHWNTIALDYLRYPRRFLDALVMWQYFCMYCLLIPIWLQASLVWISHDERNVKRRVFSSLAYLYVVLTNLVIVVIFLPLAGLAFAGWVRPDRDESIDNLRLIYIRYVCLPLECVVLVGVTCFTVAFFAITIRMVRKSLYLLVKNSKQVRTQINTIVRLSIGMVFFSACVAVRLAGYILYAVVDDLPNYIMYPLIKAIPDALFLLTINLVFWPWRIPCIGAPVALAHEFSEEIKSLARRRKMGSKAANEAEPIEETS